MAREHSLRTASVNISCNGESLERVTSTKLLGVHMQEHLTWNIHIIELVTFCYGALAVLKKLRNLAPLRVKKQLVESLILSKLDYACTVFNPLPFCQQKRLQRVQNACAVYVLGRYAREADCLQLGWLPLIEYGSYQLLQCVYKALYFDYWPQYSKLEQFLHYIIPWFCVVRVEAEFCFFFFSFFVSIEEPIHFWNASKPLLLLILLLLLLLLSTITDSTVV